ncbi:type VII secretion target [Saccharopolyspora gloriosae]|uniref:type VII secretion target n=1 Tax=Saccharopolyspora gloriosae TaxID=455344 RepID=UPI001FB6D537|nr:type VII secretion target [Saccharopolyspora gloriosae]
MPYEVVSEELRAHASHLDALTDRLDTAVSAAKEVSMSDEAYGLLCSFLPPIVNPMEEEGVTALEAAREGVEVTAENIRNTAKEYDSNDEDNAESFRQFERQHLPEGKSAQQFTLKSAAHGGQAPQDA